MTSKIGEEYLIRSVERALQLLEILTRKGPMSLKALTDDLKEPKTSLYRVISTLEYHNYLKKNANNNYEVGERVLSLSNHLLSANNLKKVAQKSMEKLFSKYGDTVNIGILSNSEIVYINIIESNFALRMTDTIGSRAPIYATGLGKAILAYQDKEVINELLNNTEIKPYTQKTLLDKNTILSDLQKTKEKGYSFDNEEVVEGARCIAAPIFEASGTVIGAVSISGPKHRFSLGNIDRMGVDVIDTANEISKKLGYIKESNMMN